MCWIAADATLLFMYVLPLNAYLHHLGKSPPVSVLFSEIHLSCSPTPLSDFTSLLTLKSVLFFHSHNHQQLHVSSKQCIHYQNLYDLIISWHDDPKTYGRENRAWFFFPSPGVNLLWTTSLLLTLLNSSLLSRFYSLSSSVHESAWSDCHPCSWKWWRRSLFLGIWCTWLL